VKSAWPGAPKKRSIAKLKPTFIPPELRENTGEIAAAENHKLPYLITLRDMKGDLQIAQHGQRTERTRLEEMAEAAARARHQYIAITDHSKAVTVANGPGTKAHGCAHQ